jgi:hypothetical protein
MLPSPAEANVRVVVQLFCHQTVSFLVKGKLLKERAKMQRLGSD